MDKGARRLTVRGVSPGSRVVMAVAQRAGARQATGMVTIEAPDKTRMLTAVRLGVLQATNGWSSLTGVATIVVTIEGEKPWRGTLAINEVSTK